MPTEPTDADKAAADARKKAVADQDNPETPYPTQEQNDRVARGETIDDVAPKAKRGKDDDDAKPDAVNRAVPSSADNPPFKNR